MDGVFLKQVPLLKIVIIFILGLIFGYFITIPFYVVCLATCLSLILTVICIKLKLADLFLGLTIFFIAITHYQITVNIFPAHHIIRFVGLKEKIVIEGYIASHPVTKDSVSICEVSTKKVHISDSLVYATSGKILLRVNLSNIELNKDDHIQIFGILKKPPGERNPGEFNYEKYLASRRIYGVVSIYDSSNIQMLYPPYKTYLIEKIISHIRIGLEHSIDKGFGGQSNALLKGLLLGERGEITDEIKEAFSKVGVMHVLAVSGLHVGFIVMLFTLIFKLLPISRRWHIPATMLGTLCYMLIVGFKPPVVRATIIVELYLLGRLIQRSSNPINLVAVAAIIILVINPLTLFQPSFQLSFVAFISIIYFYKILAQNAQKYAIYRKLTQFTMGNYALQLFLVSIAATTGTLPLTIYYFQKLPLISVFMNILIIPLTFIIVILGFSYLAFSFIYLPFANAIAYITTLLLNMLIAVTTESANLSFSYIEIFNFNIVHIFLIYWFVFLIFNLHSKLCRKALITSIFSIFLFLSNQSLVRMPTRLEVAFIDVGQGDATLIQLPGNKTIIIDGGDKTEWFDAGKRHVVPYLKRRGIHKIDALILSHADNDHIGGIPYILKNIPVATVYDNGIKADTELFQLYSRIIDSLQIDHRVLTLETQNLLYDEYGIFAMHPTNKNEPGNLNNSSVVMKLIYGEISFLFTGDIEQEAEAELKRYGTILKSDIMKVPHHGSKTSSTFEFLKTVQPKYAIISVGEYNRFDHPAKSVLTRLDSLGAEVIRTDENGAIIFRTDGKILERIR